MVWCWMVRGRRGEGEGADRVQWGPMGPVGLVHAISGCHMLAMEVRGQTRLNNSFEEVALCLLDRDSPNHVVTGF